MVSLALAGVLVTAIKKDYNITDNIQLFIITGLFDILIVIILAITSIMN